jgi:uncharacterized SAM-binding protein YcdF (DUF218 family)
MFLYLFCILLGLAIPSIARYTLSELTGNKKNELYDQADAVTLNIAGQSRPTLWFNMGWWQHK